MRTLMSMLALAVALALQAPPLLETSLLRPLRPTATKRAACGTLTPASVQKRNRNFSIGARASAGAPIFYLKFLTGPVAPRSREDLFVVREPR
jgi:hypothetical protein